MSPDTDNEKASSRQGCVVVISFVWDIIMTINKYTDDHKNRVTTVLSASDRKWIT